ncbi:MAG: carboxypeptidase-like regulatory domain-containing protein [Comamonadaceae bacterium]|nr:carboxypeptidase-like regulatory domain-containing protein [Comamonadaceae bacterium]
MKACRRTGLVSPSVWRFVACAAVAAALAVPPAALAQAPATGRVQGRVTDSTGLPLPGVLVELEVEARGAPLAGLTGADGRHLIERCAARLVASALLAPAARHAPSTERHGGCRQRHHRGRHAACGRHRLGRRQRHEHLSNLSTVSAQEELVGVADSASTGVVTMAELNERPPAAGPPRRWRLCPACS